MDDRSMATHAPDRRFDTLGGLAALAAAVVSAGLRMGGLCYLLLTGRSDST